MGWWKKARQSERDVAPVTELERYLKVLQDGLITIRNYGLAEQSDNAQFCGYIADALHNLPELLLRYGAFDQKRFWQDVEILRSQIPPTMAENWEAVFRRSNRNKS